MDQLLLAVRVHAWKDGTGHGRRLQPAALMKATTASTRGSPLSIATPMDGQAHLKLPSRRGGRGGRSPLMLLPARL